MKFPKKKWSKSKPRKGPSKSYLLGLWSKVVRKQAGGRCRLCGSVYQVQSHHIIRRGVYIHSGWFNVDNGIPLCFKCHMSGIHSLHFPTVQKFQEKINLVLKEKGITYDQLYLSCKSRKVDLELTAILLKSLLKK